VTWAGTVSAQQQMKEEAAKEGGKHAVSPTQQATDMVHEKPRSPSSRHALGLAAANPE